MKKSIKKTYEIKFVFENEERADDFLEWLSNAGEQDYFQQYTEYAPDEPYEIEIDYWSLNQDKTFGPNILVKTTLKEE